MSQRRYEQGLKAPKVTIEHSINRLHCVRPQQSWADIYVYASDKATDETPQHVHVFPYRTLEIDEEAFCAAAMKAEYKDGSGDIVQMRFYLDDDGFATGRADGVPLLPFDKVFSDHLVDINRQYCKAILENWVISWVDMTK
ncbi:MAG: hypothetical protein WBP26_02395 [Candidatus Saccharimonadales bacterium]